KSILVHRDEGRSLRVFRGAGGVVTYEGQFEIAADPPWYYTDAPETGSPDIVRQVIVFRLQPVDGKAPRVTEVSVERVSELRIEQRRSERVYVQQNHEPYEAERREQKLVRAYMEFMSSKGSRVVRHCMRPDGEAKPIFSDLYNATRNQLIE